MRFNSLWFAIFVVLGLETALQCTGAVVVNSDLNTWIADNGGFVGFQIDKPCNACERGAFATKAYSPGDVIASVPLAISLKVGEHSLHTAGALYEMLHLQPEVNDTLALFWATQPRADDILTLDTFTPEQTDMLQSPPLAKAILDYQEYKARLFHSTGGILNRIFTQSDGRVIPSFDAYKHVGGLLTTRSFHFNDPDTRQLSVYLVPAIDMINHGSKARNVLRKQRGASIHIVAAEHILPGEQLLAEYDANVVHRPDMALLVYGFVPGDQEDLLLSACDLPGFDPAVAFASTPHEDDLSQVERAEEIERLQGIIGGLPSSLQEDQELLALLQAGARGPGGAAWGWKEVEIMKFRVRRKRALWMRLALLMTDVEGDF